MSNRYSTLFEHKLPSFIRDDPDYSRFIDFFDAYYQWFDDTYDVFGFGDKLDIDYGYDKFLPYFQADFLPYFPDVSNISADRIKLIKIVKELYKAKGIPDSFKFLFRALYNTSVEIYPTRDYVLRASDGKWIVPRSIKIKSLDTNFLNINNFKVFGELSQTIGVVEKSKINGKFIQIYLSNIERLYYSGEQIRILDNKNKDVYFLNGKYVEYDITPPTGAILLTSKIVGSLSNIDITPTRRGQNYRVGDPVVIAGGLNAFIDNPIGAIGQISEVTKGEIQRISVTNGGYGYRLAPNSNVYVTYQNTIDSNASCYISLVDTTKSSNISYISIDCISNVWATVLNSNSYLLHSTANSNTKLQDCFTFTQFSTYPVVDIVVKKSGTGYDSTDSLGLSIESDYTSASNTTLNLVDLGILAPIQIVNGGSNYTINDVINIIGGDGDAAFARISQVSSNGSIQKVEYYYNSSYPYPVGGAGYTTDNLPIIAITSATGANANLVIPGILGSGIQFDMETTKVGSITKINLTNNGEDYISTPIVSLRVQDILVKGIAALDINNTIVYQGNIDYPTYFANVASVTNITNSISNTVNDIFSLRVYNYRGIVSSSPLILYNNISNSPIGSLSFQASYTDSIYTSGVKTYGDGSAKASAKFLNGIIVDNGRYLNSDGQPSAHSVLQNDIYNSFTYILETEKSYDEYKDSVLNLVHPSGTRLVSKNLLKANSPLILTQNSIFRTTNTFNNVVVSLIPTANSLYSNTISLLNYSGPTINIGDKLMITPNNELSLFDDELLDNDIIIYSSVASKNVVSNTITFVDYVQYKFPNIFSGYTSSNTIVVMVEKYPTNKYSMNAIVDISDSIIIGNNNNQLINMSNNVLYFSNTLYPTGNSSNLINITLIKQLNSNNITIYKTV